MAARACVSLGIFKSIVRGSQSEVVRPFTGLTLNALTLARSTAMTTCGIDDQRCVARLKRDVSRSLASS